MTSILLKIFAAIGRISGQLSRLVPYCLDYPVYIMRRNFITVRNKTRFKSFGKRSLLSPGIEFLNLTNVRIGEGSSIMSHCILEQCNGNPEVQPEIIIGDHVSIGEYSHITCAREVVIGNGVLTGRFILITDNSHGETSIEDFRIAPLQRPVRSKGPVIIGDNVWIGDKATILPGVTIGEGSIIAANAVVTTDIPSYSVAAGCPAKVVKRLTERY